MDTLGELFRKYQTSQNGLTQVEAIRRLSKYGYNEVITSKRTFLLMRIFPFLANPLALILIIAAIITSILGNYVNASIIILIVISSAILDYIQTIRSQNAADKLQSQVAPMASVYRDDTVKEINRRELVPGDIIVLTAGKLVLADARLIESKDLHVNQAALTGESFPVEKEAESEDSNVHMVYQGTSIVSGKATAVITATGKQTQFADIIGRLAARAPETEFDRGIRRFSFFILQTVIFLMLFIAVVSIAFRKDAFKSLLFALALAVGLTPECLPMITTVTLSNGAENGKRKSDCEKSVFHSKFWKYGCSLQR